MSKTKSYFNEWCKIRTLGIDSELPQIYKYYSLVSRNRFKWSNLPKGLEGRHIENALFFRGQAFFYYDKELDIHRCLPCSNGTGFNVYGDPIIVNVEGYNFNELMSVDKGVRILDNEDALPISFLINHEIELIDMIEQTSIANMRNQKFPYIIATTDNNKLSLKNVFAKFEENENNIFIDESLLDDGKIGVQVFNLDAPYVVDKLRIERERIESDLLTKLGINNTNTDKKERLITDEVNANNGEILLNLDMFYRQRQLACEQINEKFGLDIKVEKVIDTIQVDFNGTVKEGESNEIES